MSPERQKKEKLSTRILRRLGGSGVDKSAEIETGPTYTSVALPAYENDPQGVLTIYSGINAAPKADLLPRGVDEQIIIEQRDRGGSLSYIWMESQMFTSNYEAVQECFRVNVTPEGRLTAQPSALINELRFLDGSPDNLIIGNSRRILHFSARQQAEVASGGADKSEGSAWAMRLHAIRGAVHQARVRTVHENS